MGGEKLKLMLSQPSKAGTGAELGNKVRLSPDGLSLAKNVCAKASVSNTFQTASRHCPDTVQTQSRHCLDIV